MVAPSATDVQPATFESHRNIHPSTHGSNCWQA